MTTRPSRAESYIYPYRPLSRRLGYQVRFKRYRKGLTTSISQYFSAAAFGGIRRAYAAARKWRDANRRWLDDPRFKPSFLDQRTGRPRAGVRHAARRPRATR